MQAMARVGFQCSDQASCLLRAPLLSLRAGCLVGSLD